MSAGKTAHGRIIQRNPAFELAASGRMGADPIVAAAGGDDWVKFYVLRGKEVMKVQLCRDARSFEDFDQLDRLPSDTTIPIID